MHVLWVYLPHLLDPREACQTTIPRFDLELTLFSTNPPLTEAAEPRTPTTYYLKRSYNCCRCVQIPASGVESRLIGDHRSWILLPRSQRNCLINGTRIPTQPLQHYERSESNVLIIYTMQPVNFYLYQISSAHRYVAQSSQALSQPGKQQSHGLSMRPVIFFSHIHEFNHTSSCVHGKSRCNFQLAIQGSHTRMA